MFRSYGDNNDKYLPKIVAENADSPATLQYLAPYTGAALAEYFSATWSQFFNFLRTNKSIKFYPTKFYKIKFILRIL